MWCFVVLDPTPVIFCMTTAETKHNHIVGTNFDIPFFTSLTHHSLSSWVVHNPQQRQPLNADTTRHSSQRSKRRRPQCRNKNTTNPPHSPPQPPCGPLSYPPPADAWPQPSSPTHHLTTSPSTNPPFPFPRAKLPPCLAPPPPPKTGPAARPRTLSPPPRGSRVSNRARHGS